jgi:hypothetical protein
MNKYADTNLTNFFYETMNPKQFKELQKNVINSGNDFFDNVFTVSYKLSQKEQINNFNLFSFIYGDEIDKLSHIHKEDWNKLFDAKAQLESAKNVLELKQAELRSGNISAR